MRTLCDKCNVMYDPNLEECPTCRTKRLAARKTKKVKVEATTRTDNPIKLAEDTAN